jgi:hypothetical protein
MQPANELRSSFAQAGCKELNEISRLNEAYMAESVLAAMQRRQIELTVGELLLTDDFYIRQGIVERLRHLIAHADPSLDLSQLSEGAREELQELDLLPEQ